MRSDTYDVRMRLKGGRMLKRMVLPVLTLSMVIAGARSTYAYTAVKGTVTCSSGKVRKEASTSASFAFGVRQDEEVTVIDEKKGDDGKVWYRIKVGDSTGFIRSDLIAKSKEKVKDGANSIKDAGKEKETVDNKTATGIVLVDVAILRHEASTKADLEICIKQNEEVELRGSLKGDDDKEWYQVIYKRNGISYKGYIRADLIKAQGTVKAVEETPKGTVEKEADTQYKNTGPGEAVAGVQIGTVKGAGVYVR